MGSESGYNPKNAEKHLVTKMKWLFWAIVNETLFYYSPFFCYGWRRFLLRCFGAKIARSATIGRKVTINSPWNLHVGESTTICNHAWLMCSATVTIGDCTIIGEHVKILAGSHESNSMTFKGIGSSISIGNRCWIASSALLASGSRRLKIGDGAIVGAGSVVYLSVKSMVIVAGNPAKVIGERQFNQD